MTTIMKPSIIFLMGPTASGKTGLAIELCKHLPIDIISVDSAQVYNDMDIGTAKPSQAELAQAPHRLIDICDPAVPYSVANFCEDAEREILTTIHAGRIPLLLGGTMMYFSTLLNGLAEMPGADPKVRVGIEEEAEAKGWPAMHKQLADIDQHYADSLHPNHSQRIARALEVFQVSGKTMTELRKQQLFNNQPLKHKYNIVQMALFPQNRPALHKSIAERFDHMLKQGFVEEVQALRQRSDLHLELPSMRAVGYRQIWEYLDDSYSYETMINRAVAATRQLAKRQLTWLRRWSELHRFSFENEKFDKKVQIILNFLQTKSI